MAAAMSCFKEMICGRAMAFSLTGSLFMIYLTVFLSPKDIQ